ncbi:hypothetical protein SAMN04489718_1404 [Actinopolyspora saharensis]|uniref:Transmembrane protein n=1 Tax=Actinopolyspora saharensis TaxID=995062 RepID=A0A1H1A4B2_9ACTN|nr:hypothetical protein SAMN04489718_1404 [Actinopolyspora saharensis]
MGESALRLRRLIRPGGNPLARASDRLEGVLLAVVLTVPLLALPVSAVVGAQTHAEQFREARNQVRSRTPVTAVLMEDAVSEVPDVRGTAAVSETPAYWHSPGGALRTGTVAAEVGTRAREGVRIWVDERGEKVQSPMSRGGAVREGLAAAASLWLAVLFGCAGLFWGSRCLLDRVRRRSWQREWKMFGPLWSGFRDGGQV